MPGPPFITRRFGHGAARLPIGIPIGAVSLSRLAETPARGERFAAVVPILLCGLVLTSLGVVTDIAVQPIETAIPLAQESVLQLDAWEIPTSIPNPAKSPSPSPPKIAQEAPPNPLSPVPAIADSDPVKHTEFDPSTLTIASAPSAPSSALEADRPEARNQARPMSTGLPTSPDVTDLAYAVPRVSEQAWNGSPVLDSTSASQVATTQVRPKATSSASGALNAAEWQAPNPRNDFLAQLEADQSTHRGSGASAKALPAVALKASSGDVADELRSRLATNRRSDGWSEVPLDALPDCSPPGRQDELKRQILLAASDTPTCTNDAGSYRFIETRNLNAFLMWSRTNPDGNAGPRAVRDVCDVLAHALNCLADSSMQETQSK